MSRTAYKRDDQRFTHPLILSLKGEDMRVDPLCLSSMSSNAECLMTNGCANLIHRRAWVKCCAMYQSSRRHGTSFIHAGFAVGCEPTYGDMRIAQTLDVCVRSGWARGMASRSTRSYCSEEASRV